MNQKFFIIQGGEQIGPLSFDELKSKGINGETLVWTDGLPNWTKASNIPLLKDLFLNSETPPPPPPPRHDASGPRQQNPSGYNNPVSSATQPINSDSYFGFELAGRRERFFAIIIESIIIAIPSLVILDESLTSDPWSLESILAGAFLSAIFGAIFYSLWGGSLGHRILGLVVVSSQTGEIQKNPKMGALREALKSVLATFILPVIWLIWDPSRQNVYDKILKTYVVKKKRTAP